MEGDVTFICVTPIRDEAWVLPFFLETNSQWADHIILLDQASTDQSAEIAKTYSKVILIKNESKEYDELYRQQKLYEEARKIKAKKKIIFALDADEFIPPALLKGEEWKTISSLSPGTRIYMPWIQMLPDFQGCYGLRDTRPFGYVDDGESIAGGKIHNDRVPKNGAIPPFYCNTLVNVHLGFVPVIRNYKKQTWYLMWEFLNHGLAPFTANVNYRKYNGSDSKLVVSPKKEWLPATIKKYNLDISEDTITWWDRDIIGWFEKHGVHKFRRLDIWDLDWNIMASQIQPEIFIKNPQNIIDKRVITYTHYARFNRNFMTRALNYFLKVVWK